MEDPIKHLKDERTWKHKFWKDMFGSLGDIIQTGDDAVAVESVLASDDSLDIRKPHPAYRLTLLHMAARFNHSGIATVLVILLEKGKKTLWIVIRASWDTAPHFILLPNSETSTSSAYSCTMEPTSTPFAGVTTVSPEPTLL